MPRGKALKNPNGYGSVVKLSGKRRNPFEVRVNTRMDERYYPVYDVPGRFPSREKALIALADYNKNPFNVPDRNITFSQLYEKYYKNKYELSGKTFSRSSMDCTRSAYRRCNALYNLSYRKLRADDFGGVLGQAGPSGNPLSHAMQEHIKNLFTQMDKFALQNGIIEKGYAAFASITVPEDDTPGVPFTADELRLLWNKKEVSWVDSILFYIYSGWRVSELIQMPAENIDLIAGTFKGGLKTIGSATYHTPHGCRHTFTSMLDSAGVNQVCIDRLIGHASASLTTRTYTHKSIEELRQAVEMI